ncbi:MAG TPA: putative DNA binding domain-containing protein [Anaerolineae bacterium]|nr:putative DNA binding domain-containing protein [Anaerolineae bacterium]HQK14888.1 putative DNA binding domain-containing protein [Anaerolineae bacterium]
MAGKFRSELFTEPTEYEEEPLRDRKSRIPDLRRDDEKAEFIRDVIALANTARMFGQPAYLLYGLKDNVDEGYPVCGLGDLLAPYGASNTQKAWEELKRSVEQAIAEYIQPQVQWELAHGQVNGQDVAYLRIDPLTPSSVFCTARKIRHKFNSGVSWIRFGESKREICRQDIAPDDDRYRYAYSSVPLVLPRIWKRYFEGILNDRKSAENLSAAQDIRGYQDLYTTDGRLLQKVVEEFLNDEGTLLIIEGAAGSGKSAFVQRRVAAWAEAQLQIVEIKIEREEFTPPAAGWIPVYHRLRNEPVRTNYCLAPRLLDAVNKKSGGGFWESKKRPERVDELFCKPELHWVICLDGLDEIRTQQGQSIFLETLRDFLETYPHVKVILTTRPDTGVGTLKGIGEQVTIAPFRDEQIELYFQNWAESEEYEQFIGVLRSNSELWEMCRTPTYLEAACHRLTGNPMMPLEPIVAQSEEVTIPQIPDDDQTGEPLTEVPKADEEVLRINEPLTYQEQQAELPPEEDFIRPLGIGEVLYAMYDYLWRRELGRHSSVRQGDADLWWEKTGLLAIKMDGSQPSVRISDAQRELKANGLRYVLSLGILKRVSNLLRFNTELTKTYFAAAWLRDCLETGEISEARRLLARATAEFICQVRDLLEPLTAKDIQPLFEGGKL